MARVKSLSSSPRGKAKSQSVWRAMYHVVLLNPSGDVVIDSDHIWYGTDKRLAPVKNTKYMTITKLKWDEFVPAKSSSPLR